MTYEKIEAFLFSEAMENYLKEGFSISLPIPAQFDGQVAESFFISNSVMDAKEETPFARVIANCESKKLLNYSLLDVDEVTKIKEQRIGNYQNSDINRKKELIQYKDLYCYVKEIAYKDIVDERERDILMNFFRTLLNVVGTEDMKFYISINESFFAWLNSIRVL